ncbi:MAG: energy transducer TonB [Bacteroidota bacterium]
MKNLNRKPNSFITQPTYPGGAKALNEFITANLKYPEEALQNQIQGTVSVDFDIDVFGVVSAPKIKHGIGYGCNEEAIRLVTLLKFSKRKYQGVRVVFHRNLNIHFKLNSASKPVDPKETQPLRINYTTTQSPEQESKKSNVINISINLDPDQTKK